MEAEVGMVLLSLFFLNLFGIMQIYKRYRNIIIATVTLLMFKIAAELSTYYSFKYMDDYQVIPGSYNQALSDSLSNALLHTKIKFDEIKVKVYDSVAGSSYHYIEGRLKLKENYLSDDEIRIKMKRKILTKIFEKFPPDLYTGKIETEYKGFLSSKVILFPIDTVQLKLNF